MSRGEGFQFEIRGPLSRLLERYPEIKTQYPPLAELQKLQTVTELQKQPLLDCLAHLLRQKPFTLVISRLFRPLLVELVARMTSITPLGNVVAASKTPSPLEILEETSMALSRLLRVSPQVQGCAFAYFKRSRTCFERIIELNGDPLEMIKSETSKERVAIWRDVAVTAHNLLKFNAKVVRYHTAESVALILGMNDAAKTEFFQTTLGMTVDFFVSASLQEMESSELEEVLIAFNEEIPANESAIVITAENFSRMTVDVCGVTLFKNSSPFVTASTKFDSGASGHSRLVFTETTRRNLHSLALALSLGDPVFLEGLTGSGKTRLVEYLAQATGQQELVKIHLGDQTDGKVLLGTYVCTDIPGEFKWQPGVLTRAVEQGKWILIEDIDLAPQDVISILIPILEARELFIPSRGEKIKAAPGFQLFGTQTLFSQSSRTGDIGGNLWTKVRVEPFSLPEMEHVIEVLFPALTSSIPTLMRVFAVASAPSPSGAAHQRHLSMRDLLKWCDRIHPWFNDRSPKLKADTIDRIFLEAIDCFCAMIPKKPQRNTIIQQIGEALSLSPEKISFIIEKYQPALTLEPNVLTLGRVTCPRVGGDLAKLSKSLKRSTFANTSHSLRLMERISVSVQKNEAALLVGETGTGKTSVVQHLAEQLGHRLVVINMSQQSESSDLLGGFKPVDIRLLCVPLFEEFDKLFGKTFSRKNNQKFLDNVGRAYTSKSWNRLLTLFNTAMEMVDRRFNSQPREESRPAGESEDAGKQKDKNPDPALRESWRQFSSQLTKFQAQKQQIESNFLFSFVEGTLVKAVRQGHWVLLDEINLASTETLECLSGLLEGPTGTLLLTERGDGEPSPRHKDFRVFACMNPATDVGKRDLPPGVRNRMTEIYVDELENSEDLELLVKSYLRNVATGKGVIAGVVAFYLAAKKLAHTDLTDGQGQKAHYSLRTLSRALEYASLVSSTYGSRRALYEGFCMSFLTQLNPASYAQLHRLIVEHLLGGQFKDKELFQVPTQPGANYILLNHFWVETGSQQVQEVTNYIQTPSVLTNMRNLVRVVVAKRFPVLIQGPTSSGKTSMIEYLAKISGHKFVRINNHEHTDLQEYLGTYVTDETGKLVFQEGVLVEALRKGYWIVLDELNLAPSDVLEALNRLLDDNRELFIPETQEIVKPHLEFMLFATQNPPGLYGGRKVLSRAFRNRFLELHFDEIPDQELETILEKRCQIAPSYCKKLVLIYKDLQNVRQGTRLFAGKHGFITLRDLFRWAERDPANYQQLAEDGFMLLGERVRRAEEKSMVKAIIQKHLKATINEDAMYDGAALESSPYWKRLQEFVKTHPEHKDVASVVWTKAMKRLFCLVTRCLQFKEPILLVGETGCGKTTICQVIAAMTQIPLYILNCHEHTETADFLGGQRPARGREQAIAELIKRLQSFFDSLPKPLSTLGEQFEKLEIPGNAEQLNADDLIAVFEKFSRIYTKAFPEADDAITQCFPEITHLIHKQRALFGWVDGPLVQALKQGHMILLDEISLADDSVLERLNSVLETGRTLVLAEKGGAEVEQIKAHEQFRFLATMNPGGDYGKKELSPALRNRFTEIWVPTIADQENLTQIIEQRFTGPALKGYSANILGFVDWFSKHSKSKRIISLRDILAWVTFMNQTHSRLGAHHAYVHGACMVLLDGIGTSLNAPELLTRGLRFMFSQVSINELPREFLTLEHRMTSDQNELGIGPFRIQKGPKPIADHQFAIHAPTTSLNAFRILRAMQVSKPILLEGSPGVGKTSLVQALASIAGHQLVRINLSEQTDLMDLFGSDLPVEGGKGGEFAWRDGPFLMAMKAGHWVLLDELNLASQSVLEGLNACLDHRGVIYIPELDMTFEPPPHRFRVFAAQNPSKQGGGRKGLPKSFLNRFSEVYVEQLTRDDLLFISSSMFPVVPRDILEKMVAFNGELHREIMVEGQYGRKGSPWEFNLRDMFRWLELMTKGTSQAASSELRPEAFLDTIYLQRMRTLEDRERVQALFCRVFQVADLRLDLFPPVSVTPSLVRVGSSVLRRNHDRKASTSHSTDSHGTLQLLHRHANPLESLMRCVELNWMTILTGDTASGKTSLVRTLSHLTGNELLEFAMNSSVDTTEILGGFEQMDLNRYKQAFVDSVRLVTNLATERLLVGSQLEATLSERTRRIRELQELDFIFSSQAKFQAGAGAQQPELASLKGPFAHLLACLNETESFLKERFADFGLPSPQALQAKLEELLAAENESTTGRFEWISGILIKALETGAWVLIDNVNFCSPSVLDRLNPLLENNGVLAVSERGLLHGELQVVKPHPNFRLFLAMDPKNGEISRAMRNRGIEICLIPPVTSTTTTDAAAAAAAPATMSGQVYFPDHDTLRLLKTTGLPKGQISRRLAQFFTLLKAAMEEERVRLKLHSVKTNLRDLLHCAKLVTEQLQRGVPLRKALMVAVELVFVKGSSNALPEDLVRKCLEAAFDGLGLQDAAASLFLSPSCWPHPVTANSLSSGALLSSVLLEGSYLHSLVLTHVWQLSAPSSSKGAKVPARDRNLAQESFGLILGAPPGSLLQFLFLQSPASTFQLTPAGQQGPLAGDLLKSATALFNEGATASDWMYRASFYRYLLSSQQIQGDAKVLLECRAHLLESTFGSKIWGSFLKAAQGVLQALGLDTSLATQVSPVALNQRATVAATAPLQHQLVITNALFGLCQLQQGLAEADFYDAHELGKAAKKSSKLTTFQQSALYQQGRLSQDQLPNEIVVMVYPMLSTLKADLASWMEASLASLASGQILDITLAADAARGLLISRELLWKSLCTPHFDIDIFNSLFLKFKKLADASFEHPATRILISDHMNAIVLKVFNLLQVDQIEERRQLQKYGAQTPTPKTQEVYELTNQLRNIGAELDIFTLPSWRDINDAHAAILCNEDFKRTLIEGLATLSFLNDTENSKKRQLLDSISSLPQYLEAQLKASQESAKVPTPMVPSLEAPTLSSATSAAGDDEPVESELDIDPSEFHLPSPRSIVKVEAAVWPIQDIGTTRKEFQILNSLIVALFRKVVGPSSLAEPLVAPEVAADIGQLFNVVLTLPFRNPDQFVPLQSLLWAQQGHSGEGDSQVKLLGGAVVDLLSTWHQRLWKNTFTLLSPVRSLSEGKKLLASLDSDSWQQSTMISPETQAGSPRLFQAVQAYFSFSLNQSLESTPISESPEKIKQFSVLRQQLSLHQSQSLREVDDWMHLVAVVSWFLAAQKDYLEPAHYRALTDALEVLLQLMPGLEDPSALASRVHEPLAKIDTSLQTTTSVFLGEMAREVVRPFFNLFLARLRALETASTLAVHCDHGCLGKAWVLVGQLLFASFLLVHPIDPATKAKVALTVLTQEEAELARDLLARESVHEISTGTRDNPIIAEEKRQLAGLAATITDARKDISYRPEASQIQELFSDIQQLHRGALTPPNISDLLRTLEETDAGPAREKLFQATLDNSIDRLAKKYPLYRDLTQPIISAIFHFKYGMRLLAASQALKDSVEVVEIIKFFGEFPQRYVPKESLQSMVSNTTTKLRGELLPKLSRVSKGLLAETFVVSLQRCAAEAFAEGTLDSSRLQGFEVLFDQLLREHSSILEEKQEEERKLQDLYKFRPRVQTLKTDEEIDEEEFRASFPDFAEEFASFDDLEPRDPEEDSNKKEPALSRSLIEDPLTARKIQDIHHTVFSSLSPDFVLAGQGASDILADRRAAFQQGYNLATKYLESLNNEAPQALDAITRQAHLVISKYLEEDLLKEEEAAAPTTIAAARPSKKKGSPQAASKPAQAARPAGGKPYDFYRDSNVSEAKKSFTPLTTLTNRLRGLLEQWPEHEVLRQLMVVTDRVLQFPVASPLMKILTGLEIILQKAQDWEQYASKAVSLKVPLHMISRLVIRWRQIEVKCWASLLEAKAFDFEAKTAKFWFHLYKVVMGVPSFVVREDTGAEPMEPEEGDAPAPEKKTTPELTASHFEGIISTLDQFMQTSSFGEFQARLRLLRAFQGHLQVAVSLAGKGLEAEADPVVLARVSKTLRFRETLINILGNIASYYAQFLPKVLAEIDTLKAPIEKELKELVKIAKWKDINFFALKQSAEKTHRSIHKFTKKFTEVLFTSLLTLISREEQAPSHVSELPPAVTPKPSDVQTRKGKGQKGAAEEPKAEEPATEEVKSELELQLDLALGHPEQSLIPQSLLTPLAGLAEEVQAMISALKGQDRLAPHNRLPALAKRLRQICADDLLPIFQKDLSLRVDEAAISIIQRLEEFRVFDATNTFSEETKKAFQLLKTQKRMALTDLLKALQFAGLSHHKAKIDANQFDATFLLKLPQPQLFKEQGQALATEARNSALVSLASDLWRKADGYHYRNLSRISALRKSSTTASPEVSRVDLIKGTGIVEHLLHITIRQRSALAQIGERQETLAYYCCLLSEVAAKAQGELAGPGHHSPSQFHPLAPPATLNQLLSQKEVLDSLCSVLPDLLVATEIDPLCEATRPAVRSQLTTQLEAARARKVRTDSALSFFRLGAPATSLRGQPVPLPPSFTNVAQENDTLISGLQALIQSEEGRKTFATSSPLLLDALARSASPVVQASGPASADAAALHGDFVTELDSLTKGVLLAIQSISKSLDEEAKQAATAAENVLAAAPEPQADGEEKGEPAEQEADDEEEGPETKLGMEKDHIFRLHKKFISVFSSLELDGLARRSQKVLALALALQHKGGPSGFTAHALQLLQQIYPLFSQLELLAQRWMCDFLVFHKSLTKLEYVLANLFDNLCRKGFCLPKEMQSQAGQEGDTLEDVEGTGMAEGEGKKDVSDQIEDEEQITGLKGDEQREQSKEMKHEEEAIEMNNEFEGELFDRERPQEDEDKDQNNEPEEELESQMGKTDNNNPDEEEGVDEKMWGDESEDEETEEKDLEDSGREGGEKQEESKMVSKDQAEQDKKEDKKKEKGKKDNKDDGPGNPEEEEEFPEGDEGGDEANDQSHIEEEALEDHEQQAKDAESNRQKDDPEEEEFPEDLNLDGGKDQDEDENMGAPEDEEEEGENPAEEEKTDQSDFPEDGQGGKAEDRMELDIEEQVPEDQDSEAKEPPKEDGVEELEPEQKDDGQEDEDDIDYSKNRKNELEESKGEDPMEADEKQPSAPEQSDTKNSEVPLGVQGTLGNPSTGKTTDESEKDQQDLSKSSGDSAEQQMSAQSRDQGARLQQGREKSEPQQNNRPPPPRKRDDPNPHRSMSEALERWKKKLSNVKDQEEKVPEGEEKNKLPKSSDDQRPKDGADDNPDQMYEHVEEDEHADTETLANADEEQMKKWENSAESKEDVVQQPEPEPPMDPSAQEEGEPQDMEIDEEEQPKGETLPKQPEEFAKPSEEDKKRSDKKKSSSSKAKLADLKEDKMEVDPSADGEGDSSSLERGENKANLIGDRNAAAQPEGVEEAPPEQKNVEELRAELESSLTAWRQDAQVDGKAAMNLWHKVEGVVHDLALELTESLRLILEPTLTTKLRGDYRTGKRLNMKKIIPYIASQFKKDKIWLRRTKPSKRQYQVMIAVDDSKSMSDSKSVQMAYETVALISTALSQLEVGEISLMSFGQEVSLLHPFEEPFNADAGAQVLSRFTFKQDKTYFGKLVEKSAALLEGARAKKASTGDGKLWQLQIIISDGMILDDDRNAVRKLVKQAIDHRIFMVYIAIDNREKSLLDLQSANFVDGKLSINRYLDTFPFDYYVLLRDIQLLPNVLSDALRQWFEMIKSISD